MVLLFCIWLAPFTHNLLSQYSSAFVSNLTWLYRLIPLIHHPLQTYIHTYVIVKIKKKNFQCPTLHMYLCIQQYTWSCPIIFIKENNLYLNKVNALLHTYEYIHNEPIYIFKVFLEDKIITVSVIMRRGTCPKIWKLSPLPLSWHRNVHRIFCQQK